MSDDENSTQLQTGRTSEPGPRYGWRLCVDILAHLLEVVVWVMVGIVRLVVLCIAAIASSCSG